MNKKEHIEPIIEGSENLEAKDLFNLPENYFDNLLGDIQDKIAVKEKKWTIGSIFQFFLQPKYAIITLLFLVSGIVFATMVYKGVILDFKKEDPQPEKNTPTLIVNDNPKENQSAENIEPLQSKKEKLKEIKGNPELSSDDNISTDEVINEHQNEKSNSPDNSNVILNRSNSSTNSIPLAQLIQGPSTISVCEGDKVVLKAFQKEGYELSWSVNSRTRSRKSETISLDYRSLKEGRNAIALNQLDPSSRTIIGTDTVWIQKNSANRFSLGENICSENPIELQAPAGYQSYVWENGSTSENRTISETGNYAITAFYGTNMKCSVSDSIHIKILPEPTIPIPSDQTICKGEGAILDTELPESYKHLWLPSGNTDNQLSLDGLRTGYNKINLQITGCKDYQYEYLIQLKDCNLTIPNYFTPNADGFNDKFVILGLDNYPQHELIVMNRQGQKVYQSKNYNNDWGADNLEEGVYFYILRLGFGKDQFDENGTLSIYRNRRN